MKKRIFASVLAATMVLSLWQNQVTVWASGETKEVREITLDKGTAGNPIAGFDLDGNLCYAGDPSILVDGDRVYMYVGHDTSTGNSYNMPEWLCYSTTDMKTWTYESVIMNMKNVSWADNVSAWAAQTMKYNDMYYFFYCAQSTTTNNKEIAVAVSDSPTGPFKDLGPVVYGSQTDLPTAGIGTKSSFQWEDIDPTFWVDEDENGKEHVYLCWGNTDTFMCEISITDNSVKVIDRDKDGKITLKKKSDSKGDADIWYIDTGVSSAGATYTEAPWIYRRQDEDGKYYGQYYMFYAQNWREEMAYSTTDDIENPTWTYGGRLMDPSSTSNTNHMAVFDFKGHTYFVYHNGMLPYGSGYRRVACIEEINFNEDGSLGYIQQTSTGLTGISCQLYTEDGKAIEHENYENSLNDELYPYTDVSVYAKYNMTELEALTEEAADPLRNYQYDAMWEIERGKADGSNEGYVSIQSYDKPGLYLTANDNHTVTLAQDYQKADSKSGLSADSKRMTFRTLEGFNGKEGYTTFESIQFPGYYLARDKKGNLIISSEADARDCSFAVEYNYKASVTGISASKTKTLYKVGEKVDFSDLRVFAAYSDNTTVKLISDFYKTNADEITTASVGVKTLTVEYVSNKQTYKAEIMIKVYDETALSEKENSKKDEDNSEETSKDNSQDASESVSKKPIIEEDTSQLPKVTVKTEEKKPVTTETSASDSENVPELPAIGKELAVGNLKYEILTRDAYNTNGTNGTVKVTGLVKGSAKVIIPATVEIDGYTFAVKEIGPSAFEKQKKLKSITIGNNISKIGTNAFSGISKKATIKVAKTKYKSIKKLLKSSVGVKKTMKIKKV